MLILSVLQLLLMYMYYLPVSVLDWVLVSPLVNPLNLFLYSENVKLWYILKNILFCRKEPDINLAKYQAAEKLALVSGLIPGMILNFILIQIPDI